MNRIILISLLVMIAGCSPELRVYTDHDPDYNLSYYKTFDWSEKSNIEAGKNPLYYNELNDKRIKSAVVEQLTNLGYMLKEENPDLIIHYHIVVDDKSVVTTDPFGYHYGPYWMHTHAHVYQYNEGTLIIDLMDANSNNLIWRGWAISALGRDFTPAEINQLINSAVAKIFRNFPLSDQASPRIDEVTFN